MTVPGSGDTASTRQRGGSAKKKAAFVLRQPKGTTVADIDTAALWRHVHQDCRERMVHGDGKPCAPCETLTIALDWIDHLRARLADAQAERDIGIAEVEAQRDKALADLDEMTVGYRTQMETISGMLPKLREVEAERDGWKLRSDHKSELAADNLHRLNLAETRLANVLALCCACEDCDGVHMIEPCLVRAAVKGAIKPGANSPADVSTVTPDQIEAIRQRAQDGWLTGHDLTDLLAAYDYKREVAIAWKTKQREQKARAEAAEARLAAVLALAQMVADADGMLTGHAVLAAARWEDGRG